MIRAQLPVYSPVTCRAVLDAGLALAGGQREAPGRVERHLLADLAPHAVRLCGSGTVALAAAIRIAAGAARPLVALPAYACYDLATAADMADASVVLYDLDPDTLGPDWSSLAAALASGPSGLVVAHLFGYPVDLARAAGAARNADAVLIEDAAQGVGAEWHGRPVGNLGDLAVLSFGRGKGRTGGRGGALLANTAAFVPAMAEIPLGPPGGAVMEVARLKAQWLLSRPSAYGLLRRIPQLGLGQTVYRPPEPMTAMSPVSAAALARSWAMAGEESLARKRHAAKLLDVLEGHPRLRVPVPVAGASPGFLRLPVIARSGSGGAFGTPRAGRLGIMPGYPRALVDLPGFEARVVNRGHPFTGARFLASALGTLPTHSRLRRSDLAALRKWLLGMA